MRPRQPRLLEVLLNILDLDKDWAGREGGESMVNKCHSLLSPRSVQSLYILVVTDWWIQLYSRLEKTATSHTVLAVRCETFQHTDNKGFTYVNLLFE